jgi:putative ABC transport system substrate-binding protein
MNTGKAMRRLLIGGLLSLPLSTPFLMRSAMAQRSNHTVMLILFRGRTTAEDAFMLYLKERVPVEFLIRDIDGDRTKIRQFLNEARQRRVDLVYSFGTTVTQEVVGVLGSVDRNRHLVDIPVVFNIVADPVGAGLADGLAATGRNVTGVSHLVPLRDQISAMQRFATMRKLGVIYNVAEVNSLLAVVQLRQLASSLEYELIEAPLGTGHRPSTTEIEHAMERMLAARPDFVYLPSDSSMIANAQTIVRLATAAKVPVISATESPIYEAGALFGMVTKYVNAGAFAGYKAEQILLKKQLVGSIPIERLQRYSLVINMNAAAQLGIYPPLDLLRIAELVGTPSATR